VVVVASRASATVESRVNENRASSASATALPEAIEGNRINNTTDKIDLKI